MLGALRPSRTPHREVCPAPSRRAREVMRRLLTSSGMPLKDPGEGEVITATESGAPL